MLQQNKELIEIIANCIDVPEPIYEFGSLQVAGQEEFADLRPYFPGKTYVGCDMREGTGVDLVMDVHSLDTESGSVGTVISIDTLEHVERFWTAVEEFHRVLRPDGLLVLTSVMKFGIHDHPHDFWRFTPDGFRSLTRNFATQLVLGVGEPGFPKVVAAVCFKGERSPETTEKLSKEFGVWKEKWDRKIVTRKSLMGKIKRAFGSS
ncbi:MAG: methyltransferase domain-containing protein [Thermodesulfobacteriota bacterium]